MYTSINREVSYHKFIIKKINRLLIPYFSLSTIAYLIKVIFPMHARRPIAASISNYVDVLVYPGDNPIMLFWFIPTLFIIFLFAPVMKKLLMMDNVIISSFILIALAVLHILGPGNIAFMNISTAFDFLVYFYLGCFAFYYFRDRLHDLGNLYVLFISFLCMVVLSVVAIKTGLRGIKFAMILFGVLFPVSFSLYIDRKELQMFRSFDGYSYQIFLLSWFPQVFIWFLFKVDLINRYFAVFLMILGGLYVPVIVAKIVGKRLKILKIIIGLR